MNVLVIGATGPTGQAVVVNALAAGHKVTALARDPAKLDQQHPDLRVVTGDVLAPDTLEPVMQGQDAVISALGSTFTRKPTELVSTGTANVIAAMKKSGVPRLICITGFGAGESRGEANFVIDKLVFRGLLAELYRDKDRQEDEIRRSGLDWIIVRPVRLTKSAARGYAATTDMSAVKSSTVTRADVASFCVDQLLDDSNLGHAVAVGSA